jgi:hypothetical protein
VGNIKKNPNMYQGKNTYQVNKNTYQAKSKSQWKILTKIEVNKNIINITNATNKIQNPKS